MNIRNYVTFAGRVTRELVVGTAVATKDAGVAAVQAYSKTIDARSYAFVLSEVKRLDSPLYEAPAAVVAA